MTKRLREPESRTTRDRGLPSVGQPNVPFAKTRTATLIDGMTYSHCSQLLPIPQSRPPPSLPRYHPYLPVSRSPPEQSVSLARSSPSRPLPHPVSTHPPVPSNRTVAVPSASNPLNPHHGTNSATSTPWHHFPRPRPLSPLDRTTSPHTLSPSFGKLLVLPRNL